MKNLFFSYTLCALGLFTPFAGMHRFYLDKPFSGLLYFFTWGFFGIGTIVDLVRMPTLQKERNLQFLFSQHLEETHKGFSPERAVLKCAQKNNGIVTVPMVALDSNLSMAQAKAELDRLFREGFCSKDIDQDSHEIYEFTGLSAKKPLI
jgi:TM2 domain-containing membrane protein YozV